MSRIPASLVLALTVASAACVRHAAPPQIPHDADPGTRESTYAANQLTYERPFLGHRWRRADGAYGFAGIDTAVDAYPASKTARKHARNRNLVVAAVAALGGALIGTAAGNQMFVPADESYSRDTLVTLYGSGAALVVLGIVLDQTWTASAYSEIAPAYNNELRRDLALPPQR